MFIPHAVDPRGYCVGEAQGEEGESAFGVYGHDGRLVSEFADLDSARSVLDVVDPPSASSERDRSSANGLGGPGESAIHRWAQL